MHSLAVYYGANSAGWKITARSESFGATVVLSLGDLCTLRDFDGNFFGKS